MDFTLSREQVLLGDSVARFASAGAERADTWKAFNELGGSRSAHRRTRAVSAARSRRCSSWNSSAADSCVSAYVAQAVLAGAVLRAADRADLLEESIEGRRRFAVAYEEPHARYDPARVESRAQPRCRRLDRRTASKVRVLDAGSADTFSFRREPTTESRFSRCRRRAGTSFTHAISRPRTAHDVADVAFDGVRASSAMR